MIFGKEAKVERTCFPAWVAVIRTSIFLVLMSALLFFVHHNLQVVYYRTCRANLISVVLHHRSDICHGLHTTITAIEQVYQHGMLMFVQGVVSATTVLLPYLLSFCSRNLFPL